jgi:Uma2 family endonuclease
VAIEMETLQVHRWTPEAYHRLVESGGFDDDTHIELIDGLLVDMSPKSPAHENVIEWLDDRLQHTLDRERFRIRVAMALSLGTSEPEPDVAVVARGAPQPYHPASAALVIEVSASSLGHDLRVKPIVYARAGIPLYWVVDLDGRRAVVHSQPGPDGYAHIETHGPDGELAAPHIGISRIALADLLRAARS